MQTYAISFEITAFVLSLFCLLYSLTVKRKQYVLPGGLMAKLQSQHFVFIFLLLCNLLSSAASVGGVFLQGVTAKDVVFWQYLFHAFYFFFHNVLAAGFALYIMNVNGTSIGRRRLFWLLFFLPFAVSELLVLTNGVTGMVFTLQREGGVYVYHRGALIKLLYAIGALYIILGSVSFFRYTKAIPHGDGVTIGIGIILATAGVAVQALFPTIMVELFAESLAFLVLMMLLEERAGHIDPVTGALNRKAFIDSNRRFMKTGKSYRIVLIRLTNLTSVSSLFSGRELNGLLMQISAWLASISSEQDLYRYRENRFAIILPGGGRILAKKIIDRFGRDWHYGQMTLRLDAAVSVIHVPRDVPDIPQLEEILSYDVRIEGEGSRLIPFETYTAIRQERAMETALRSAVDEGRLRVWYQPIWSATEGRTVAAEALLRVEDDLLRSVSPEVYIPIAERSDLIRDLGLFVFGEVCRFLRDNPQELSGLQYVEVNLSVYQFLYEDLIDRFEAIRKRYGVPASRINLELTETASMRGSDVVSEVMRHLHTLGYSFSMDDFGTGYSNLYRLINGAYTNVKIDKNLLWDAKKNKESERLLDSLIRVIRGLGYHVVQEGVETEEQLRQVIESGCDLIQGYLFSRPVPPAGLLEYLASAQEPQSTPVT